MIRYCILDPNIIEELCRDDPNFKEKDIWDLSLAELIEKYGDPIADTETIYVNNLDELWEEVMQLIVDYYENKKIVEALFAFIPKNIETLEHILQDYNYVLKIEL